MVSISTQQVDGQYKASSNDHIDIYVDIQKGSSRDCKDYMKRLSEVNTTYNRAINQALQQTKYEMYSPSTIQKGTDVTVCNVDNREYEDLDRIDGMNFGYQKLKDK